jgi:2-keto-4-pentenoate hydratase/2-oxohepta-3-ene-1,7-dioic acid hydratase in catechol pathway
MGVAYRLGTVITASGPRAALLIGDSVYDAANITGKSRYCSVPAILKEWIAAEPVLRAAAVKLPVDAHPLRDVSLMAPLPTPGTVFCTGSNYRSHSNAMDKAAGVAPRAEPKVLGFKPWLFLKPSRCVVGPDAHVAHFGPKSDYEAELAAVIGRTARNVTADTALQHVAAYTIANDLSARHRLVRPQMEEGSPFRFDWVAHKSFDGSCPTGPWLTPAADIADPQNLDIRLWVNDRIRQDANTSEMIFTLAEQIAQVSSLITLEPGDLILTGTPGGVGAETGDFLHPGDHIRIEIESLGRLVTYID